MASVASFAKDTVGDVLRETWLRGKYFDIVERVILAPKQTETDTADEWGCTMLVSPKRRRIAASEENGDSMPRPMSVQDITNLRSSRSDAYVLEAFLLYFPDQERNVSVTERRTKLKEPVAVATCIVADREGPLLLDLWRNAAPEMIATFQEWTQDTEQPPLVEIKYFVIQEERRPTVTPVIKIVNSERTEIRKLLTASQPSVKNMMFPKPIATLYTRDFSDLERNPPFLVSLCGVIIGKEAKSTSQNGVLMVSFKLVDANGKYVTCTALGRHADNSLVTNGSEVVVYYANANVGTNNKGVGAQVWLYDDSHIAKLKQHKLMPVARVCVRFG